MSSLQLDLVEEALQDFSGRFHASVPLQHFSVFYDDARITEVAQLERSKVLAAFLVKISQLNQLNEDAICDNVQELGSRIQELIKQCKIKNQAHLDQSESFMQKRIDIVCEEFNLSVEMKLLSEPNMDLEDLDKFLETSHQEALVLLDKFWKFGHPLFQEGQRRKLEESLKALAEEAHSKQSLLLDRKMLENVKATVLQMSVQIKDYVHSFQAEGQGYVPKNLLMEKAEDVKDYLLRKGYVINEKYRKIYSQFSGTIAGAIKALNEAEEQMTFQDSMEWADRIEERLRFYCLENERGDLVRTGLDLDPVPTDSNESQRQRDLEEPGLKNNAASEPSVSLELDENDATCGSHCHIEKLPAPTQNEIDSPLEPEVLSNLVGIRDENADISYFKQGDMDIPMSVTAGSADVSRLQKTSASAPKRRRMAHSSSSRSSSSSCPDFILNRLTPSNSVKSLCSEDEMEGTLDSDGKEQTNSYSPHKNRMPSGSSSRMPLQPARKTQPCQPFFGSSSSAESLSSEDEMEGTLDSDGKEKTNSTSPHKNRMTSGSSSQMPRRTIRKSQPSMPR